MRVPGLEPWWAWDTTVPLTIQPQVGSQGCGRLRGGVWETWGEDAFFSVLLLSGARHTVREDLLALYIGRVVI